MSPSPGPLPRRGHSARIYWSIGLHAIQVDNVTGRSVAQQVVTCHPRSDLQITIPHGSTGANLSSWSFSIRFPLDSIDPPSARDSVPSTTEVDKEGGSSKGDESGLSIRGVPPHLDGNEIDIADRGGRI
jgi:hypothetical protein